MFNPEMMKKYSEVGMKVQELQAELAQTEVECATKDGGVTVKVSGTQVPMSVTVSEELCASDVEKVSAELTSALKSAHTKSGVYAQDRMRAMYDEVRRLPTPDVERTLALTRPLSRVGLIRRFNLSRVAAGPVRRHGGHGPGPSRRVNGILIGRRRRRLWSFGGHWTLHGAASGAHASPLATGVS